MPIGSPGAKCITKKDIKVIPIKVGIIIKNLWIKNFSIA